MYDHQEPIINSWYTNLTGKLFKVRMAEYGKDGIGNLVVEYIDGAKQIISRQEWDCLKLMKHNVRTSKPDSSPEDLVTN